jgi:hypothetical protein
MKRSELVIRCTIVLLLLLAFAVYTYCPVQYLFDEGLRAHKTWFPRFYLFTYLFFKMAVPVLFGVWCAINAASQVQQQKYWVAAFGFFIGAIFCLLVYDRAGFNGELLAVLLILFGQLISVVFYYLISLPKSKKRADKRNALAWQYGFLLTYMAACLLVKDGFHPFYKFSMYNKIEERNYVFILRNSKGELLPLDDYLTIGENGLYRVYMATHDEHAADQKAADSASSGILWHRVLDSKKRSFNGDTIVLIKKVLQLQNGKIAASEHELYRNKID